EDFGCRRTARARGKRGGEFGGLRAIAAGKGVRIAGIDDERARFAAFYPRAAPLDRRRGTFRFCEDPRDLRAFVEESEHHICAIIIANPGGTCSKAHAGNFRQIGIGSWRERGGGGHKPCFLETSRLRIWRFVYGQGISCVNWV